MLFSIAIIMGVIICVTVSTQFFKLKKSEKENLSFYKNVNPEFIKHIIITEIAINNKRKKNNILVKKIMKNEIIKNFGNILHNISKRKASEKPIALRMFNIEIGFLNGTKKEMLVWIQKVPSDRVFIQFIERFNYFKGLLKGEINQGDAESKMLKKWLDDQINL